MDKARSRNAQTVRNFYDAEQRRDIAAWEKFWAEDGRHTFWLATPTPPVVGRPNLVATTQRKFDVRPPYLIGVVVEPMEDPARVLARLHLTMTEPVGVTTDIWCMFHFDSHGKVIEIEEILDTAKGPAFPN